MDTSILLAQLFGLYFLISGVSVLLNQKALSRAVKGLSKNYFILYYLGFFTLIIGLLLVLTHNVWVPDWRMIITIFAWLTLLKGLFLVLAPLKYADFINHILRSTSAYSASAAVMILIGWYLTSIGF